MLFSSQHHVLFAHYPKTAGSSMREWFKLVFPDHLDIAPDNPHLTVRAGMERLRSSGHAVVSVADGGSIPIGSVLPWRRHSTSTLRPIMILGVIREPFEMLVSLYNYWRRLDFHPDPASLFITAAREKSFRDFVELAVIHGHMPTYEHFFTANESVGTKAVFVDFDHLEAGLAEALGKLGIAWPGQLQKFNVAPKRTCWRAYASECGPLMAEVRRYFRWYYDEAWHRALRGTLVVGRSRFFSRGLTNLVSRVSHPRKVV